MEAVAGSIAALLQAAGEIAAHSSSATLQQWQAGILHYLKVLGTHWSAFIFHAPVTVDPGPLGRARAAHSPDELRGSDCVHPRLSGLYRYGAIGELTPHPGPRVCQSGGRSHAGKRYHDRAIAQGVPEEVYRNVVGLLMPDPREAATHRRGPVCGPGQRGAKEATFAFDFARLLDSLAPGPGPARPRAYMLLDMLNMDLIGNHYPVVVNTVLETLRASTREGNVELLLPLLEQLLEDAEDAEATGLVTTRHRGERAPQRR